MTAQLPPQPHGPYRPQHTGPYLAPHTPYAAPYPAAPPPYVTSTPHVIRGDRNGMGTAGLVLGVIALSFAVLPIVGLIAWVLWPLGVVFSGVGLNRANQALATNRSIALAGLIVSLTAAAVCLAWVVFTVYASATGAAAH